MDGKIMSTENTLAIVLMALISVSCFGASESKIEIFTEEKGNITQGDDIKQLKKLALSVGWDFSPNQITNAYLKDMNINRIRSINIDKFSGSKKYISSHLSTCIHYFHMFYREGVFDISFLE